MLESSARRSPMLSLVLGLLLAAQPLRAEDVSQNAESPILLSQAETVERSADPPKVEPPQPPPQPRIYQAPRMGQPRSSVSGSTRGIPPIGLAHELPPIRPLALAPGHVAQTVRPRPRLFWSVDRAHDGPVVFTLSTRDAFEPACELELPRVTRAGVQAIDLASCPAELEIGVEYDWFVAVVLDPQKRSRDAIAQGWIRRVAAPADLDLEQASPEALARGGLWYDALQASATRGDRSAWQALMGELSLSSLEPPSSPSTRDTAEGLSAPGPGAH
jgi:hypothetical protein